MIASSIKQARDFSEYSPTSERLVAHHMLDLTAALISTKLSADNPSFDTDAFLTSCGVAKSKPKKRKA